MICYESIVGKIKNVLLFGFLTVLFYFFTQILIQSPYINRIRYIPIGWIGGIISGCFLFFSLFKCVRRKPAVLINESGIKDCRLNAALIPWADVQSLSLEDLDGQKILIVWGRFTNTNISFDGLKPGINEVWRYLQNNFSKKILKESYEEDKRVKKDRTK